MNEIQGEANISIEAPVETVYRYLADFTRHPEWVKNIQKIQPLNGNRSSVGARFKTQEGVPPVSLPQRARMMFHFMRGVLGGGKMYSIAEITALEPDKRIAWRGAVPNGDGYFNLSEWEFLFEPQGTGTHLRQRFCYKPQTAAAASMLNATTATDISQACTSSLVQLKKRVESGRI